MRVRSSSRCSTTVRRSSWLTGFSLAIGVRVSLELLPLFVLVLARHGVLELTHPRSERTAETREPLGPKDHEHDDEDDDQLEWADVRHVLIVECESPVAADLQPSSVLSDATIRELIESGRIVIDPFDPSMIQPASVDIHLGNSFRVFHNHKIQSIDLGSPPRDLTEHVEVGEQGAFVIHPGEFVLGRTHEVVEIPDDLVCRIEGKALALDTEIPTPDGWTTMGEISVGDEVFGPGGDGRPVIAATDVMEGRPCYELTFSD